MHVLSQYYPLLYINSIILGINVLFLALYVEKQRKQVEAFF